MSSRHRRARSPQVRALLAAALTLPLAACTSAPTTSALTGSEWQVTNIYLKANEPSSLPPTLAGSVTLVFGEHTLTGYTGCANIQAITSFTEDRLELTEVQLNPEDGSPCTGTELAVHQKVSEILRGGPLTILHPSDSEMVLRADTGQPDPPALRLARPVDDPTTSRKAPQ